MFSMQSHAALRIEITQGVDTAMPIAVVPFQFKGVGTPSTDMAKIIEANLQRSGLFQPMNTSSLPQRPAMEQEVEYRLWRSEGVESLIIGKIEPLNNSNNTFLGGRGTSYKVEVQLLDVFKGPLSSDAQNQTVKAPRGRMVLRGGDLVVVRDHILLSEEYVATDEQFRELAHKVSDLIYEKLTGVRGAFSTNIIYVTVDRKQNQQPTFRLEMADADGFNPKTLLTSKAPILSPAWSPLGDQVAYVSFENNRPEVFIQDIKSGQRVKISSFKGINSAPAWSPDGRHLALVLSKEGNPEIYTLEVGTRYLKRLTRHPGIDTEPQWSPDGKSLLFTSGRGGRPQIYRYTLSSGRIKRLTFEGDYNARGRFTPNGNEIVMVHRRHGQFHIAKQNLKTGNLQILTQTELDESPSVAPNGSMVIYGTQHFGKGVLAAVSIDGRVKLRLPAQFGEVREPAWSPFKTNS